MDFEIPADLVELTLRRCASTTNVLEPLSSNSASVVFATNSDVVVIEILGDRDPPYRVDWIITRGLDTVDGDLIFSDVSDHPYCWALLTPSP